MPSADDTNHKMSPPEQTFSGENEEIEGIRFVDYKDESQLERVMSLVARDLSEPYSIFTYRYFLHRYPELCILAVNDADEPIGCVVGKIDEEEVVSPLYPINDLADHQEDQSPVTTSVGYIGMLAVTKEYRRKGIGKALVQRILRRMRGMGCTSATLETEVTNMTAGKLYSDLGFVRDEFLVRYYLNWNDAYRLRLWF